MMMMMIMIIIIITIHLYGVHITLYKHLCYHVASFFLERSKLLFPSLNLKKNVPTRRYIKICCVLQKLTCYLILMGVDILGVV